MQEAAAAVALTARQIYIIARHNYECTLRLVRQLRCSCVVVCRIRVVSIQKVVCNVSWSYSYPPIYDMKPVVPMLPELQVAVTPAAPLSCWSSGCAALHASLFGPRINKYLKIRDILLKPCCYFLFSCEGCKSCMLMMKAVLKIPLGKICWISGAVLPRRLFVLE